MNTISNNKERESDHLKQEEMLAFATYMQLVSFQIWRIT